MFCAVILVILVVVGNLVLSNNIPGVDIGDLDLEEYNIRKYDGVASMNNGPTSTQLQNLAKSSSITNFVNEKDRVTKNYLENLSKAIKGSTLSVEPNDFDKSFCDTNLSGECRMIVYYKTNYILRTLAQAYVNYLEYNDVTAFRSVMVKCKQTDHSCTVGCYFDALGNDARVQCIFWRKTECKVGYAYHSGKMVNDNAPAKNAAECLQQCKDLPDCKFWDFSGTYCRLRSNIGNGPQIAKSYTYGPKFCQFGSTA